MLYKVQITLKLYFNLIFARLKSCIVQLSSLLSTALFTTYFTVNFRNIRKTISKPFNMSYLYGKKRVF